MADNHPMQRFYGILSGYSHLSHVCITAEYTLCGHCPYELRYGSSLGSHIMVIRLIKNDRYEDPLLLALALPYSTTGFLYY